MGEAPFDLIAFPGGPYDVADEIGDNRPLLVLLSHDAVYVGGAVDAVPQLVERIFKHKGADDKALRLNRNALAFLVADEARKDEMRHKMQRRLALQELKKAERIGDLAEHQQAKVRELESKSEQDVAVAIQQCYRHVFYPTRSDRVNAECDLGHTAIDAPSASASPGIGQRQVERALRDSKKLRTSGDEPDSPSYIRDRTPLKKGEITTRALREEFRRDPALPMLAGDDVFVAGIRRGVEQGEYVYRRGDLLYGEGDPQTSIIVDEQSTVFTMSFARQREIWPRSIAKPEPPVVTPPADTPGGSDGVAPIVPVPTPPVSADLLVAEGVLKEALTQLWEKARKRKIERVHVVRIRMFDAGDAFKLLGVIGSVQGATKTVTLDGGYVTVDGSEFNFDFSGPSTDAQVLKEFLEPQLRAASERSLNAEFALTFNGGLLTGSDAPERLADRLTKYAAGTAYVTAFAETAAGGPS
jgi:hypothetical protein